MLVFVVMALLLFFKLNAAGSDVVMVVLELVACCRTAVAVSTVSTVFRVTVLYCVVRVLQ